MERAHKLGKYEFASFSDVFQGPEPVSPDALADLFYKIDTNDSEALSLAEITSHIVTTEMIMETEWSKLLAAVE